MNYFLKKLGLKEDRISVGLNRLSIVLIILQFTYIRFFFHNFSGSLLNTCIRSFFTYLIFTLLALFISCCRYGFHQQRAVNTSQLVHRKANILFFFSLRQMGIKEDIIFYVLQMIGAGCALIVSIPFFGLFLLMCGTCFITNPWSSEDDILNNDIGVGISSGKELLEVLIMSIVLAILIYAPFVLLSWVWSGFLYGVVRDKNK
ncbi:hypothetical protein [Commensalibacter papalotli (ex Servin-Garciduenas et al. 2014)]|uniref:Uncharacterized protein n=1 Tax=Commensalibacter papalotli (ex Servin-Garciduenas et al. 2014) TaxID=1208583 RepID=W7DPP6_9PROT|nr:hypothetical protein [Commensalibacter papalotli (ex Servin-Garciduenas et al. 2014)]EUK19357.1 hypothetical protein COMX_06385 [Commensalibacter papalotli (ex Servin-Garciduenas et al. 2014)]